MINTDSPAECDVVVIGAGMGGLTCAALLAKAGLSVCVLDMASREGGYLAGFRRGKYTFDTAIHWLNQCGEGGLVTAVFDHIGPGSPVSPPLRKIRRYRGESFDYLLTNDPNELRDQLIRDFPHEERGLRRFFDACLSLGETTRRFAHYMRTPESMTLWEKARGVLQKGWYGLPFLRFFGWSTARGLRRFFRDEKLMRIWCTEEQLLSCMVPIGWAYVGDYQVPPTGGSMAFPSWLCGQLQGFGATVAYHNEVDKILLGPDGRATGVRALVGRRKEPREVRCRYVIAACDLQMVYERALPPGIIPQARIEALRKAEMYDSCVTVHLSLDVPPEQLGFGEELVFVTRDDLATRAEHNSGDPHKAGISVLAPSLRDPSLAPPGAGSVTLYVSAHIDYADRWKTGPDFERGEAYKAYKAAYADVLIDRVAAALAPDLRAHITRIDVATPVTHRRYTGNKDGTIMGARPSVHNLRHGLATYRTPVPNLLLGGHWAEIGGGVPIAVRAGANCAAIVLRTERPDAFVTLRDVLDGRVTRALADAEAPQAAARVGAGDPPLEQPAG